jgi:hypothetical protein
MPAISRRRRRIRWLPNKDRLAAGAVAGARLRRFWGLIQSFSRRDTQSETASPLLMSGCTRPSTMKVGDTWMPFCRAYLQCHLISRSRSGMPKASVSLMPL